MGQRRVTVALAGDVMLGRLVNVSIAYRGFAHPWGNILPMRDRADLFLINLECALTSVTEEFDPFKPFHFRADPGVVETLRIAKVNFASVANNHSLDFGPEGLAETLRVLDAAGIAHAGGGRDRAEAEKPAMLEARGLRLGVVAAADYPETWAATEDRPGINFIRVSSDERAFAPVARAVERAREAGAGRVIFCIHWGPNMRERPSRTFREFAHRLIDAGADILWGHSAHVVQGIEFYRGGVIFYDTGDFIDDYAIDEVLRNDLSALFYVEMTDSGVGPVRLLPVRIQDMQVNVADAASRAYFVGRLRALCAEMGTAIVEDEEPGFLMARPR